jgi:toxin ParE1/3/4
MPAHRFDVELTQGAENDLEEIYDYMTQNRSADAAESLLVAFLDKISTLESFPLRGGVPKELDALGIREFRQTLLSPYRLIYRVAGRKVFIMVIADGRRDMQALLERRLLSR